jgi:hypothetical protein
MTDKHPITPPPELVQQWHDECHKVREPFLLHIANQAARWGSDQELEACCLWLLADFHYVPVCGLIEDLRAARRPKPPSLKEQALDALREAESTGCLYVNGRSDLIRKALEALPE